MAALPLPMPMPLPVPLLALMLMLALVLCERVVKLMPDSVSRCVIPGHNHALIEWIEPARVVRQIQRRQLERQRRELAQKGVGAVSFHEAAKEEKVPALGVDLHGVGKHLKRVGLVNRHDAAHGNEYVGVGPAAKRYVLLQHKHAPVCQQPLLGIVGAGV